MKSQVISTIKTILLVCLSCTVAAAIAIPIALWVTAKPTNTVAATHPYQYAVYPMGIQQGECLTVDSVVNGLPYMSIIPQ